MRPDRPNGGIIITPAEILSLSGKHLTLRIPGSTSNLGPAFDTVALALAIYCRITFILLDKPDAKVPLVTLSGAISERSRPEDIEQLIYKVLNKLWKEDKDLVQGLRIVIDSDIPLGIGLGGSPAAILGALWAAAYFKDYVPTTATLLADAGALEGHHESVAASLMGNMVVCSREARGPGIIARQHDWPAQWKTLLLVPQYTLKTEQLRAVLPKRLPFEDAVANIQRTALLVSAVARSDEAEFKEALVDKIHEPYRETHVPLLSQARRFLAEEPIIGCVLSGAGPSVLVIVNNRNKEAVLERLKTWAAEQTLSVLDLDVDRTGVEELSATRV